MRHWAEELARDHLAALGYVLLEENYLVRGGEVDLVMRHGETLVFVEVRQRNGSDYGSPGETIGGRKLALVRRAARVYLAKRFGRDDLPVRFDAVLVHGNKTRHRIEHLPGVG